MDIIKNNQLSKVSDSTDWNGVGEFLILNYAKILEQLPKKETTIKTYIKDAKDFIQIIEVNGLNFNSLRQFRKDLEKRVDIGAKTKNKKLTVARKLLKELYNHYQLIGRDISTGAENFKIDTGHVKDGLQDNEIEKIKIYIEGMSDAKKKSRIKAMFCLLAFQGLRQFELCNIEVKDINFYDCTLRVKGKGSDSKGTINLHPSTCEALNEYQKQYNRKDGYLFTSISTINQSDDNKELTTTAIRMMWNGTTTTRKNKAGEKVTYRVKGIFQKADVHGRSVHGFRHFFVTRMLEATKGDILATMKFSRHKSMQSVKAYDDRKSEKELLPTFYAAF